MVTTAVRFTLTALYEGPEPYSISQHPDDPITVLEPDGSIRVPKKKKLRMNFKLVDPNNQLAFVSNKDNAFLISPGLSCPSRTDTSENESFQKVYFAVSNGVLSVTNKNKQSGTFSYRICIEDTQGKERDFDPVIINGGGGEGLSSEVILVAVIGGVIALVGLAYFAGLLDRFLG